ncbi:MAG: hypothetical protein WED07_13680 [Candidatus Freyarchaeum deiterrae]
MLTLSFSLINEEKGTKIKEAKLGFYSPAMHELINTLIEKKKKEHDSLFKEVNDSIRPNFPSGMVNCYMDILGNKEMVDTLLDCGYDLLAVSALLSNIVLLTLLKSKIDGVIERDFKDKLAEAEEKVTSAKVLLTETYGKVRSYLGFEWLIFAYTYFKEAETSVNLIRARDDEDSELFFQACLAIELCSVFSDFVGLIKALDEKAEKAPDLKKSMKDFAFEMIQQAECTLKTVQPEHVNNQEEEALLTKTLNYLVPIMEKAFQEEDYLTAIDTAQTVIYNAELIKAAFVQAPSSYLRSQIEQKFVEFNQLILKTREKGRFDAILPIFYYEKAAGPLGEPSKMIASANLSMILIGVMEKELRPTTMFTT